MFLILKNQGEIKMKKRWLISFAIGAVIILLFFLVRYEREPAQGQYRIGVTLDLTGTFALYGQWADQGIEIARNELKEKGKNVDLMIEDCQSESKAAVSALQKLININNVKVVIGSNTSSSAIMAMAPIAEKNKIILFVTTASSPSIADAGDFIFRNRLSGDKEVETVVKAAKDRGITRISFTTINNQAGQAYASFFQKSASSHGLNIVTKQWIDPTETNLNTYAAKLKNAGTKAIFYAGPVKTGAILMKNCAEIGYRPLWLSISPMRSQELFKLAGDVAEGLLIATEFPDTSSQQYKLFNQIYVKKYNAEPTTFSVNAYDAVKFLVTAIDSAGYNPVKIKNFLYRHTFSGAGGRFKFNNKGEAVRKVYLMQVKGGKFILVKN